MKVAAANHQQSVPQQPAKEKINFGTEFALTGRIVIFTVIELPTAKKP